MPDGCLPVLFWVACVPVALAVIALFLFGHHGPHVWLLILGGTVAAALAALYWLAGTSAGEQISAGATHEQQMETGKHLLSALGEVCGSDGTFYGILAGLILGGVIGAFAKSKMEA